ncbi:MAG: hypothetical protein Q7T25_14165 [Sideroxyarcus sp.]|nr:hypothetical protein [Sideroxyarcus sp.]
MAGIDKIYGTVEQWDELHEWVQVHKSALKYFYPRDSSPGQHTIANFPEVVDRWLLGHCPIKWVVDRIKEQYGINHD